MAISDWEKTIRRMRGLISKLEFAEPGEDIDVLVETLQDELTLLKALSV